MVERPVGTLYLNMLCHYQNNHSDTDTCRNQMCWYNQHLNDRHQKNTRLHLSRQDDNLTKNLLSFEEQFLSGEIADRILHAHQLNFQILIHTIPVHVLPFPE